MRMKRTGVAAMDRRLLATTFLLGALTPVQAIVLPTSAYAQQSVASFSVPAGDLSAALRVLGNQSGWQISYSPQVAAGKSTRGVSGTMSGQAALSQVLAGTGLSFRTVGTNAVTITNNIETTNATGGSSDTELAPIILQSDGSRAFGSYGPAGESPTALKMNLSPRETPATVNTTTSELMAERGEETVYEAIESFAGVTSQGNNSDTGSNVARSIFVRGFDISSEGPTLINGQRVYSSGTNYRSTAALDRVELLRGAAGIYYGASQPGGIFNYVYKQPLDEERYSVSSRIDTLGSYGVTLDATGPIDEANTLRYRAIGDFVRNESEVDHIYERPAGGMLAFEWEPTDTFKSNLTYEYTHTRGVPQRNDNISVGGRLLDVPRDFFWGHTNDFIDIKQHTLLLENNWQATDWLNVRTYLAYQSVDQEHLTTRIGGRGPTLPNTPTSIGRTVHAGTSENDSISAGFDLSGEFDTGGFGHSWLFGYGYARGTDKGGVAQCSTGGGGTCAPIAPTAVDPTNHSSADYVFRDRLFGLIGTQRNGISDNKDIDHNLYLQDMITLPNQDTKLIVGLGYTWAEREDFARRSDTGAVTATSLSVSDFTPRLAISHDLNDTTTIYASYSESYLPQLITNPNGTVLDQPETGTQYEIGFKSELFDGNALLTVAAYQLDKENIARAIDGDPDGNQVLNGLERARGVEVELSGSVTQWWDTRIAYAFTDTEVVKSASNEGNEFAAVSKHSVSLWNRFTVYGDKLDAGQWSIGAGLTAYSDFYADAANAVKMPGYGIVDLGVFYEKEFENERVLKAGLRIDNLFDKTYYDRRSTYETVTYGEGRKLSFSISSTF